MLFLLIFLLLLCISYSIAACFQWIFISIYTVCLCPFLTRGGMEEVSGVYLEFNFYLVLNYQHSFCMQEFLLQEKSWNPEMKLSACYCMCKQNDADFDKTSCNYFP